MACCNCAYVVEFCWAAAGNTEMATASKLLSDIVAMSFILPSVEAQLSLEARLPASVADRR
jgi:hypothetical protein